MVCWADMVAGRLPARVRLFDFLGLLLKCDLLSRKRGVDILCLIGPHTGPQELGPDDIPGHLFKGQAITQARQAPIPHAMRSSSEI